MSEETKTEDNFVCVSGYSFHEPRTAAEAVFEEWLRVNDRLRRLAALEGFALQIDGPKVMPSNALQNGGIAPSWVVTIASLEGQFLGEFRAYPHWSDAEFAELIRTTARGWPTTEPVPLMDPNAHKPCGAVVTLPRSRFPPPSCCVLTACIGKTVQAVSGLEVGSESVTLLFTDNSVLRLYHQQDCCESVQVYQIDGEAPDLQDVPLVMAEIVSSENEPAPKDPVDHYTWTFVKFATVKGYLTIRWLGDSNGYYSEVPAIELEAA